MDASSSPPPPAPAGLAARVAAHDWGATPLGPLAGWPDRVRAVVDLVLASPLVASVALGPERRLIYNDAAACFYGNRHPGALGCPLADAFAESYPTVAPFYDRVFAGEAVRVPAQPLPIDGRGEVFDAYLTPVRDAAGAVIGAHMIGLEISAQARAQAALRDSEERQAFLLRLSDALRPVAAPLEVARIASQILGAQLAADRVAYAEFDPDEDTARLLSEYCADGVSPLPQDHYRWSDFDPLGQARGKQGLSFSRADALVSPDLTAAQKAVFAAVGFRGLINVPLVKSDRLVAFIAVHWQQPYEATAAEISLVEDVAERTWAAVERARAEAARRASEERFRALATAGGSSIYRMSPDWRLMYELDSDTLAVTAAPIEDWVEKYIPPGDLPAVRAAIDTAIRGKSLFELEHGVWAADGGIAWVISRAVPLLGPDGEIVEWFGAGTVVTERKRAQEALRESEERYRMLFESMDEAYAVVEVLKDEAGRWADFRFIAANPAFTVHTNMPYPVGQTATELLGSPNPRWTELYGKALDTGETLRVEESEAMLGITFDLNIFALNRAQNRVAVLFSNITNRKQAEAALRESEERQRLTVELVPALLWSASPDGQEITLNDGWTAFTGQSEAETQDYGWLNAIHPDDLPATQAAFEHAFAIGEPIERQQRMQKAGDGWRWHLVRHVPVRDEHGTITRWFGAAVDIHDSTLAEQALDESERRQRALIEGVPHMVWRAVDSGEWTWASPQWTEFTGQAEEDSHGFGWLEPVHPDDRERVCRVWAGALERGEFHADYRLRHAAEHRYRWFQTRASPVRDERGTIVEWFGTSTDVDDLRALRDRQDVLLAELQHRVRNVLAVIRSIIRRSKDGEQSLHDYAQHLEGRMDALARTQVLLTRQADAHVDLEDLIRDELLAQAADEDRVTLTGPAVELSPKAAEVLGLALHELATNAIKYGAIGRDDATLAITWEVERRGGEGWLALVWSEFGVPLRADAPRRSGFGTELITRRVPFELRGEGNIALNPNGIVSTIAFPLRNGSSLLETGSRLPTEDLHA